MGSRALPSGVSGSLIVSSATENAQVKYQLKEICQGSRKEDRRGPSFRTEPPSKIEFPSSAGTELRCGAEGNPAPKTHWQNRESVPVTDVPGLRYQRRGGSVSSGKEGATTSSSTLVFPPFAKTEYRREVHDAVYQCVISNDVGTILSREVHVRGVVNQRFSPQVYDEFVTRRNTAVLRCHLPSFARELVTIDAWLRNDGQVLKYNTLDQQRAHDGRSASHTVLRSGELLIHETQEKDSTYTYRCQTRHKLTGEMVSSESSAKIMVTELHVSTLPRVTFSLSRIQAEEGSVVQLPCVAQGNPPPSYRWMKDISGILQTVEDSSRVWIRQGILTIARVSHGDNGQYQCIARNSIGEKRIETTLIVTAPLIVALRPRRLELGVGQEASFSCNISGYPLHQVFWVKDGKSLSETPESRTRLLTRDVLHISSVRKEDEGMYQCFAHNDKDSAQAAAELTIAEAPPSLISVFPERAVQPGDKVSLQCVSTGNPLPEISWSVYGEVLTREGARILINNQNTDQGHVISRLNITDVRADDGGEFKCEASNDVGSNSHSARLNVVGSPFVRRMRNATAISGTELMLQCPYGGHPVSRIKWLKDDIMLPLNSRQRVSPSSGTLSILQVERAADEGRYTCVVNNPSGDTASGTTYVTVVVAPQIHPAFFPESLTVDEGGRTKMVCIASKGDPPLRFKWLKNQLSFLAHGDTTVQTFDDTSMVTFKKVTSLDRGTYTCIVSNGAASANRTVHLIVNVPPNWTVEPRNTSAILGSSVWMDCAAVGYPAPTILWKRLIYADGVSGDFTWVHSSPRAHRFNNGTLALTQLEESDAGAYLCQAHNAIGAGLTKVVHLKILVPPRFRDTYQSATVAEGTNVSLRCVAEGDQPIKIVWWKEDSPVDAGPNQKYIVQTVSEESQTSSELIIRNASRIDDTGEYTCAATSNVGDSEAHRQLTVQGKPDPPTNLSVANVTSRSLVLLWTVVSDGHSPLTGSLVQYKNDPESNWSNGQAMQMVVSSSEKRAVLKNLVPVTTYLVRVIAQNALGKSSPSAVINITTDEEAPSGTPRDVRVHSTGAQSMKVTWKEPSEDTHHGRIRGYHVGFRMAPVSSSSPTTEPFHFQKVDLSAKDSTHSTYITGLEPSTRYEVVVRAFNSAGTGPSSPKMIGKTLETAPPTSPVVQVRSTSNSSIVVNWEKETRDKSAITEYTLHYRVDGDEGWNKMNIDGQVSKFILKNLKCGTRYNLYVTASNSLGTGEPSVPVVARTTGAAPMSPKLEAFIDYNSSFATLHLNRWQSMGCRIQRFSVQYRPKHQARWSAQPIILEARNEDYLLGPLVPGREYVVLVTALSEAGATQGEYHFRTLSSAQGPSIPAFGKHETEQPFYRNVILVVPVVVSSFVLIILAFSIALCFKKHARDRQRGNYENQKSRCDSLAMTDLGKQDPTKLASKTSHYAIPGKTADYAEPYVYNDSLRQGSNNLFATIKRCPTRSIYTSASNKTGSLTDEREGNQQAAGANNDRPSDSGGGGSNAEPWGKRSDSCSINSRKASLR